MMAAKQGRFGGVLGSLVRAVGLVLAAVVLLWAPQGAAAQTRRPMQVVVTIPPLAGIVRPLLPEGSQVRVLMPPGQSEHGYEFTAADLAAVAKADLLVYVGMGLEPKVEEFVRNRKSKTRVEVNFAQAVAVAGSADGHDHSKCDHGEQEGEKGEEGHDHASDPHLWLDPVMVEKLVPVLRTAVETAQHRRGNLVSKEKERIKAAADKLHADVHGLWEEGEQLLRPFEGQAIVTHHAAWGRLADRYGLKVAAVIRPIETNEPTPASVSAAIEAVRKQGVRAIFVEPQFSRTAAERIASATGVKVATLDPVGDGDWFALMRGNFKSLADALGEPAAAEAPR